MGQIIVRRNLTGTVSFGLFLVALCAFALGAADSLFRPIAIGALSSGLLLAGVLLKRRSHAPGVDPRLVGDADVRPSG